MKKGAREKWERERERDRERRGEKEESDGYSQIFVMHNKTARATQVTPFNVRR